VISRSVTAWLLLSLVLAALAPGCGLFDPREAEKPGGEVQIPWNPPLTMSVAIANIQRTLEAKSGTNYDRSLAAEFTFEGDPADIAEVGEDPFPQWDRNQEVAVMSQILSTTAAVTLTWEVGDSAFVGENQYYEDIGYNLRFRWANEDTIFSGKADLYFIEDNGQWYLTHWADKRDGSGNPTWGRLRIEGSLPQ